MHPRRTSQLVADGAAAAGAGGVLNAIAHGREVARAESEAEAFGYQVAFTQEVLQFIQAAVAGGFAAVTTGRNAEIAARAAIDAVNRDVVTARELLGWDQFRVAEIERGAAGAVGYLERLWREHPRSREQLEPYLRRWRARLAEQPAETVARVHRWVRSGQYRLDLPGAWFKAVGDGEFELQIDKAPHVPGNFVAKVGGWHRQILNLSVVVTRRGRGTSVKPNGTDSNWIVYLDPQDAERGFKDMIEQLSGISAAYRVGPEGVWSWLTLAWVEIGRGAITDLVRRFVLAPDASSQAVQAAITALATIVRISNYRWHARGRYLDGDMLAKRIKRDSEAGSDMLVQHSIHRGHEDLEEIKQMRADVVEIHRIMGKA